MKNILCVFTLLLFVVYSSAQCSLRVNSNGVYSQTLQSTGNTQLDNLVWNEESKLESTFGINASVNICSGTNGLAMPYCKHSGCNGTIELGKSLLAFEYKQPSGNYIVMAIMAHEFAHLVQFQHPEIRWTSSAQQELHADFLAGWYIGQYIKKYSYGSSERSNIPSAVMLGFGQLGDEEYWSMNHHGNKFARFMVIQQGMCDGYNWMPLDRAFKAGIYVANEAIVEYDYKW